MNRSERITDELLVLECQEGSTTAFGELVDRWQERLWQHAWRLATVAAAIITIAYFQHYNPFGGELRLRTTHTGYVTLAADGSGSTVTETSWLNTEPVPAISFPFDAAPEAEICWIDDLGREMPSTVSTKEGRSRYAVRFADPVMPGEWSTYKRIARSPALATKEGDLWACRADWSFGPNRYDYNETVMLPEGAEIVSVSPRPAHQSGSRNSPVLRFEARCESGEHFKYTIQYRLPTDLVTSVQGFGIP